MVKQHRGAVNLAATNHSLCSPLCSNRTLAGIRTNLWATIMSGKKLTQRKGPNIGKESTEKLSANHYSSEGVTVAPVLGIQCASRVQLL